MLGFAAALRRSELVALDVEDVTFTDQGLEVIIRRSKTDQESAGTKICVPYGSSPKTCPVRTLRPWLEAAGVTGGAIFRSVNKGGRMAARRLTPGDVTRVVKRAARACGLDSTKLAGHSLRAGLATAAAQAGKNERAIMAQGRWRSVSVARRYIRDAGLFDDNAAAGIGL